jgi:hypothetical protein
LPELEDQNWFPGFLRSYQTDFLGELAGRFKIYRRIKPNLIAFKPWSITDLASGTGKPAIYATEKLRANGTKLLLTDKYPVKKQMNKAKWHIFVRYHSQPIDLLKDELPEADLYTMFNSLHHFDRDTIKALIGNIKAANKSFFFAEPLQPDLLTFLKVLLTTLIGPFLLVPFIKPFRIDRIILTYLLPLGVLSTVYDGIASVLKSYSLKELKAIQDELGLESDEIECGSLKSNLATLTYIAG